MKIVQIKYKHQILLESLKNYLIVESQEYGQQEDFLYNVVCSLETAEKLLRIGGREIKDNGRSVGFWQRLGGRGIYHPEQVTTFLFKEHLVKILRDCESATINFTGSNWENIILSMPLDADKVRALDIMIPMKEEGKSEITTNLPDKMSANS